MFDRKDLTRLIVPLVMEQLLSVTIGMASTVMVASCGEAAVSAVSLADAINTLLLQIFAALATGGAIICSQYLGREDRGSTVLAAGQLLRAVTVLSAAIMVLSMVFCGPILRFIYGELEPAVMEGAKTYFFVTAMAYPFIAVYNAAAALFRIQGNSRVAMLGALLMNIVNIGGNALLIYQLNWGVGGAAFSNLLSRIVGAVLLIRLLCHQNGLLAGENLIRAKWDPAVIRSILRVGIPSGLENGIFHIGKLLVQGLIASFGTAAIAANAMLNSVCTLVNVPGSAVGLALITVVGHSVGAQDYDAAKKSIVKLMGMAYLAMFAATAGLYLLARPLTGVYALSPEAAGLVMDIMGALCLATILFWPGAFTLPNGLRAAGDVRFTMLVSVTTMWVFRIGFSYLLCGAFHMGLVGVWLAMYIDWIARTAIFSFRFFTGGWKNRQVV